MSRRDDIDDLIAELGIIKTDDIDDLLDSSDEEADTEAVEIDMLIDVLDDGDFISDEEEILIHNKSIPITEDLMGRQQEHLESLLEEYSGGCMNGELDNEELDIEFMLGDVQGSCSSCMSGASPQYGCDTCGCGSANVIDVREKYLDQVKKLKRVCNRFFDSKTLDKNNKRHLKNAKLMMLSRGVLGVAPFVTMYAVSGMSSEDAHNVMQEALGLEVKYKLPWNQERALKGAEKCDRKYKALCDLWDEMKRKNKALDVPSPQQVIAESVQQLQDLVEVANSIELSDDEKANVKRMVPASEKARAEVRKRSRQMKRGKGKKPSLFQRLFGRKAKRKLPKRKALPKRKTLPKRKALPAVKPQPTENYDALLDNPYIFPEDIAMLKELDKKRRRK